MGKEQGGAKGVERIDDLSFQAVQVAHEIKNPLAGLMLYSMHLKDKVAGKLSDGELKILEDIIDTINRLKAITEQITDYARPQKLNLQRLDLNEIVVSVAGLLQPETAANDVETIFKLEPEGVYALLDKAQMYAALTNLVLNALQAMPQGGTLKIETKKNEAAALVSIVDTGCGMDQEQLKKIYEPFYTTKPKGLGLGMPHALKVIEQHLGEINVASKVNEGTRVTVSLQIEPDQIES